jgi:uncharacterized protein with GYD domain
MSTYISLLRYTQKRIESIKESPGRLSAPSRKRNSVGSSARCDRSKNQAVRTGTNSLKNLTNLPVDRVKIDGSFVADILTNTQSAAMVRAIVNLAKDPGIGTVAEYAENARIIERLRELGVHYAQGYGVEIPRAFAEVLNELRTRELQKNRAWGLEI